VGSRGGGELVRRRSGRRCAVMLVWDSAKRRAEIREVGTDALIRRVRKGRAVTVRRVLWRPPGRVGWHALDHADDSRRRSTSRTSATQTRSTSSSAASRWAAVKVPRLMWACIESDAHVGAVAQGALVGDRVRDLDVALLDEHAVAVDLVLLGRHHATSNWNQGQPSQEVWREDQAAAVDGSAPLTPVCV
jgi:hypothetical protein